MKSFLLFTIMLFSLAACDRPGSKLIGKWTTESSFAKYMGAKSDKSPTKHNVIEFTATERIRNGSREAIELVDDGDNVIVYTTVFGQRVGQTYKFIDNNTVIAEIPLDTITYHRLDDSK
jgi:hypothetical protein